MTEKVIENWKISLILDLTLGESTCVERKITQTGLITKGLTVIQSCGDRPVTVEYPPAPYQGTGNPEDKIPCDKMADEDIV